jgi:outer membrane protein assembly factor BamA
MDPITQLTFGTTLQENIGLDKQYFGSSFEYQWSPKKSRKISFKLIDLEFVNNKNIENYFNVYRNSYDRLNTIAKNNSNTSQFMGSDGNLAIPEGSNSFIENVQNGNLQLETQAELDRVSSISERQQRLTVNNLILGSSLSFNTNSQKSLIDENFYQLKWKIEWVGNVLNKLLEFSSEKNNKGEYAINGVSPSQYIKTELDYVKHYQTGRDRILAFRFFGGIALPTGSSLSIPFSRSYFAGGANDNRAWKAYKLGPGTGSNNNEFNEANLKISTNLEYRFPLIGPLKGALFIDAGNIWNIADNIKDSDASFEKISDLSEIAVGSGFGIRYDLDFFVFRFDTAFKTYNPSLEKQNRWLSEFSLKQAVFNIGINYPF